jgi:hypothetical protein
VEEILQACCNCAIVERIGPSSILENWGSVGPLLEKVLNKVETGKRIDDIVTGLQLGDLQLWNVNDFSAIAITEVIIEPKFKHVLVQYLSGDNMKEWLPKLVDELHEYATELGCKYVSLCGRRGWLKTATPLGFDEEFTVMRMKTDGKRRRTGTKSGSEN